MQGRSTLVTDARDVGALGNDRVAVGDEVDHGPSKSDP
jgi:hypothetical protein|tara:strand:- start:425 stop:538 length:114 start_codon:yes stop_codon:yes gene_type:complete